MKIPNPPDIVSVIAGACAARNLDQGRRCRALIVGGWVRDTFSLNFWRQEPADVDLEVYGINIIDLEIMLDLMGIEFDTIGRSFGILKLKNHDVDINVPRRENRIGVKHTDFEVELDECMTPKEAALRRDFTMNSMAWDPITKELIDPYGGMNDLRDGILRMTNRNAFIEDPLRVLRGMQFISRFNLKVDPETIEACQWMVQDHIAKERVFEEWKKLMLKGKFMYEALTFLKETNWLRHYPELRDLIGNEQEPAWHPEGDTWTHICRCMDAFAKTNLINNNNERGDYDRLVVGFGTLLHDVGKPSTTTHDPDGRIRAKGHDKVGVKIAEQFMRRMTNHEELIEDVMAMVGEHMFTANFKHNGDSSTMTDRSVRRLARRCSSIHLLCYVIQFDKEGRPPLKADLTDTIELRKMADELDVYTEPPKPIMMGRHLIEMGMTPGPRFGEMLAACQDAEDDGEITDVETGKAWLISWLGTDLGVFVRSE